MISPKLAAELNHFQGLPVGSSLCPAPSINLHFSQLGVVTACCFNRKHVLGIYPQNSMEEIWNGQPIQELREALANNDLSKGCEKCQQQIEARDFGGSHAAFYSFFAKTAAIKRREFGIDEKHDTNGPLPMPMRMEFNVHNSCNLQCIMCHGLASSAIRTRREGLSPLPCPYDEAFADQLEPFLPYVVETDFMGGEPFLVPVYTMLWERIAKANPAIKTCILTNGTILDDRIKELLGRINCWIHVSIDSVVKETYEKIRRGACYEQVMENCQYYVELMRQRGLAVWFRFCPMRVNWQEIPETVQFCNNRGIYLMYNQVDSPVNLSLHTLPTSELQQVVDYLKQQAMSFVLQQTPPEFAAAADHNQKHYFELVRRLEGFLDPANRVQILRARLDTSNAVIGQYTQSKKKKKHQIDLPILEEDANVLVQASKRYVTTRLNVDLAAETDGSLPPEFAQIIVTRRQELEEQLDSTNATTFIDEYLGELIRTYSGVGGVVQPHKESVFGRIGVLATTIGAHPEKNRVIEEILDASPAVLYSILSKSDADDVLPALLALQEQSLHQ